MAVWSARYVRKRLQAWVFFFFSVVEELNGTRYQSGSFFIVRADFFPYLRTCIVFFLSVLMHSKGKSQMYFKSFANIIPKSVSGQRLCICSWL